MEEELGRKLGACHFWTYSKVILSGSSAPVVEGVLSMTIQFLPLSAAEVSCTLGNRRSHVNSRPHRV